MQPALDPALARSVLEDSPDILYLVDRDKRLWWHNTAAWRQFAVANGGEALLAQMAIGRPITSFVAGSEAKLVAEQTLDSILGQKRPFIRYRFRCDSPELVRTMQMTVTPVRTDGAIVAALFQSTEIANHQRPPARFLSRPAADPGLQLGEILTVCSYCKQVRWPRGGTIWVEPEQYYRQGGDDDVLLSHGICDHCMETVVEPLLTVPEWHDRAE